jgi:hypothetical protein
MTGAFYLVDAETGCWLWQGATDRDGYAQRHRRGRTLVVHRAMYEEHVGPIAVGMQLDHLCRRPSCVNPGHLEPVTPAENVRRSSRAKVTAEQVHEIRAVAASGKRRREIAEQFGLSLGGIEDIIYRRSWAEL